MKKEILNEPNYVAELLSIIRNTPNVEMMLDQISNYHENDIAAAISSLVLFGILISFPLKPMVSSYTQARKKAPTIVFTKVSAC